MTKLSGKSLLLLELSILLAFFLFEIGRAHV